MAFLRKPVILYLFIICILAFVTITLAMFRGGAIPERARGVMLTIFAPVENIIDTVFHAVSSQIDRYIVLKDHKDENRKLKILFARISAQHESLKALYAETKNENDRLKAIIAFRETSPYSLLTARVIGRDPAEFTNTLVIDRGENNGVKKEMPVISFAGIVGVVSITSGDYCRVMMINDQNSHVDVIIEGGRARGILEGSADGTVHLLYVDRKEEVKEGDVVVTSGIDKIFPGGLLVGRVMLVTRPKSGMFLEIEVAPEVDLVDLEEVLVVLKQTP